MINANNKYIKYLKGYIKKYFVLNNINHMGQIILEQLLNGTRMYQDGKIKTKQYRKHRNIHIQLTNKI